MDEDKNKKSQLPEAEKPERQATPEEVDKLFNDEYAALCKKYARTIYVEPMLKLRDDATYSIIVTTGVRRLKQNG